MTLEDKVDRAIRHIDDQHGCIRDVKAALTEHGELLARIDERTQQHEKRMNRADKRAAGIGASTGLLGGFLAVIAKAFWPH